MVCSPSIGGAFLTWGGVFENRKGEAIMVSGSAGGLDVDHHPIVTHLGVGECLRGGVDRGSVDVRLQHQLHPLGRGAGGQGVLDHTIEFLTVPVATLRGREARITTQIGDAENG